MSDSLGQRLGRMFDALADEHEPDRVLGYCVHCRQQRCAPRRIAYVGTVVATRLGSPLPRRIAAQ